MWEHLETMHLFTTGPFEAEVISNSIFGKPNDLPIGSRVVVTSLSHISDGTVHVKSIPGTWGYIAKEKPFHYRATGGHI